MQLHQVTARIIVIISCQLVHFTITTAIDDSYSNTWAIQVDGGKKEADRIAKKLGYINTGQIGSLEGFFLFRHDSHPSRSKRSVKEKTTLLYEEPKVRWAKQQVIKKRVKRELYDPKFNDPYFPKQWYLNNTKAPFEGYDHNVLPVWKQGIFGTGVVVSILDDGIEHSHKDLIENYDPNASYDFNSNDADPIPRRTWNDENRHGTRCAGEVAAQFNNSFCTVGVAPKAKIGGVRMLDGDVTDAVEASSLSLAPQHIEIYSASWGPDDDGRTVDGPAQLAKKAFIDGITKGRGGLGSIYVWASGNGGRARDNCNCDGYTNSIYTLSISSATEHGGSPWYSEACSSTLATTFSSGAWGMRKIVTTDLGNTCTTSHTGTSASAPLAAGILALALEVNRNVTWRDMQHMVVRTSKMDKLHANDIQVNGVGRHFSHKFGYGLLNAEELVRLARIWKTVPEQHVCHELPDAKQRTIPGTGRLTVTTQARGCKDTENSIKYLEHVEAVVSLSFTKRGDLALYLTSPSGTRSTLLAKRLRDNSRRGFHDWAFMTTHAWEENPVGTWTLEIENLGPSSNKGELHSWSLVFYGTSKDPNPLSSRKQPVPACDIECKGGCRGSMPDQCTECKNYKRNLTGECVSSCQSEREYLDVKDKQCKLCSPACGRCEGPSNSNCLSCLEPLLLMDYKCISICPEGWFKANQRCEKCSQSCQTCASKATQCTSCGLHYKLVGTECQHKCPSGQFMTNGDCILCHPSCLACSTSDSQSCTKCGNHKDAVGKVVPLFLHQGACLKSCPAGTYADISNQLCKPCDSSCSNCKGPGNKDCLSCSSGRSRLGAGTSGQCVQSCPDGYYSHQAHAVCIPCSSSCRSCDQKDPTKCLSCYNGSFLDNYRCVAANDCSNGTYANSTLKVCDSCFSVCSACTGPAPDHCTACIQGYHFINSSCVLRCPAKTYIRLSDNSCKPCPSSCSVCYGATDDTIHCLSCEPKSALFRSKCFDGCPAGTYHNLTDNRCIDCHLSCATCNGSLPNNCFSCKGGWVLNGTTCLSKCLEGEYLANSGCRKCPSLCLSCIGPTANNCTSCKGVRFLDLTSQTCSNECPDEYFGEAETALCRACPPECKTCQEFGKCTSCKRGLFIYNNQCTTFCPVGFYVNKETNACEKCDSSCLDCVETREQCSACTGKRFLDSHKCTSVCPKGAYLIKQVRKCEKCHESCEECTGPTKDECTKCNSSYLKVASMCLKSCPSHYYYNAAHKQCEPCDYYCKICKEGNGLQNCSRCLPPFVLHMHYCVQECPKQGWFLNTETQSCTKCHPSCKECIGPSTSDCTSCSSSLAVLDGFSCREDCPNGTFKNLKAKLCQKCHPTCELCSDEGPYSCTSCVKSLVLHVDKGGEGTCGSSCQPGYYKDVSQCRSCDSSCHDCYGPDSTNCLSCPSDRVYLKNTCRKGCPPGTFADSTSQRCKSCHSLCKTCVGSSSHQCSSCSLSLFLEDSTCVIRCSSKFIANVETRVCEPCNDDCPDVSGKPRNRSIQDPSVQTLKVLLQDPKTSGLLAFVVMSIILCFALFIILFGVLQLWSTGYICRTTKYTILKAEDLDETNEGRQLLMDGECQDDGV